MFLFKKGKFEEIKDYDEPKRYHKERINFLVNDDETESFKKTNMKLYNTLYEVIPLSREQTYKYHRRDLTTVLGYEPKHKDDIRPTKFTFDVEKVKRNFALISPKVFENGVLPKDYDGDFIIHDFDVRKGEQVGMLSFFAIDRKFTNMNEVSKYLLINNYSIIRVVYLNPVFRYILIGRSQYDRLNIKKNVESEISFIQEISKMMNDKDVHKSISVLNSKFNINLNKILNETSYMSNREIFDVMKRNKAFSYDENYDVSGKRAKDVTSILDFIKFDKKNPIYLDIGSNTGKTTLAIGKMITKKSNIYGIDNDEFMGKKINPVEGIKFLTYEDRKIPLADEYVDVITVLQVLHHVKDIDALMSEISRITHKGSIVIVREHSNYAENYRYIIDLEHLLYSSQEVNDYDIFKDTYYASYMSETGLKDIFAKYGFKKMKIQDNFSTPSGATRYYYSAFVKLSNIDFPYLKDIIDVKENFKWLVTYNLKITKVNGDVFYYRNNDDPIFNTQLRIENYNNDPSFEISYHFVEDIRLRCKTYKSDTTIFDIWDMNKNKLKDIRDLKERRDELFKIAINEKAALCSPFLPSVAKAIIEYTNSKKVLDMSAGWGDRLLGSIASDVEYVGFDPNIKLKEPHNEMIDMFATNKDKYKIYYDGFENVDNYLEEGDMFDLMLTSPPFFNLEIYDNKNQSIISYPKFDDWMNKWLLTSITKVYNHIKKGGFICVHIVDFNKYHIVSALFSHMKELGLQVETPFTYGSKNFKPIWSWKKV